MSKSVYIASSWRNAHGVELLTVALRSCGFRVISWVENNYGENHNHVTKKMDFEAWVSSDESAQSFKFDTAGALFCDIFIWYGPGGKDAAAELGAAFGAKNMGHESKLIYGLWAKGEDLGLMRKMVDQWYDRPEDLLIAITSL